MSLLHVTKDGKCAYCGAKMKLCEVCKDFFYQSNRRHKICTGRCRTKKGRDKKKELLETRGAGDIHIAFVNYSPEVVRPETIKPLTVGPDDVSPPLITTPPLSVIVTA